MEGKISLLVLMCFVGCSVMTSGVLGACVNDCSEHGVCYKEANATEASCLCYDGFTGASCEMTTTGCPSFCTGHGRCLQGVCDCELGFMGDDCSASSGACSHLMNCTGHGQCVSGVCVCTAEWDGDSCNNFKGVSCPQELDLCTNHGECVQTPEADGALQQTSPWTCICDEGFCGASCSAVCPSCPKNCSGHGLCSGFTCTCDVGFSGSDCSVVTEMPGCPNFCSSKGLCVDEACVCNSGWSGADCSKIDPATETCPNMCSQHGTCGSNGACLCDRDWTGPSCADVILCPANCTGKGVCQGGACVCYSGAAGSECQYLCPTGVSDRGCSGNGNCLEQNGHGVCYCESGYYGDACERKSTTSDLEDLSGGSPLGVIMVALGAVVFALLVGGFVYNYAKGKRGIKAIPGYEFVKSQVKPDVEEDVGYAAIGGTQ